MEGIQVPSFVNERHYTIQKENEYLKRQINRIVKVKKRKKQLRKIKIAVAGVIVGTAVICSTVFLIKSSKEKEDKPIILTIEQYNNLQKLNELKEKINNAFGNKKVEIKEDDNKIIYTEVEEPIEEVIELTPILIKVEENETIKKSNTTLTKEVVEEPFDDVKELELEYKDTDISENYSIVDKYLTDDFKTMFDTASKMYGTNSDLLVAISSQETTLGHGSFSGSARGIMQIESCNWNNSYNQYNFETNEIEKVSFSKLNLTTNSDCIKAGSIMFQECMKEYDYNILFALQAYNYGPELVKIAVSMAEEELGIPKEELTYDDLHPYFRYIHLNPQKFVKNWKRSTYGDGNYSDNVRKYAKERVMSTRLTKDGKIYNNIYDLETGICIKQYITDDTRPGLYFDEKNKLYLTDSDVLDVVNELNERLKNNSKKY